MRTSTRFVVSLSLFLATPAFASDGGGTDADGDGHYEGQTDCDDSDPNAFWDNDEDPLDGVDNDCDGVIDEMGAPSWDSSSYGYHGNVSPIRDEADSEVGTDWNRGDIEWFSWDYMYNQVGTFYNFSGAEEFQPMLDHIGVDSSLTTGRYADSIDSDKDAQWVADELADKLDFTYTEQSLFAEIYVGGFQYINDWNFGDTRKGKHHYYLSTVDCTATTCTDAYDIDFDVYVAEYNNNDLSWAVNDDDVSVTYLDDSLGRTAFFGNTHDGVLAFEYQLTALQKMADRNDDTLSVFTKAAAYTRDESGGNQDNHRSGLVLAVPDYSTWLWANDVGAKAPTNLVWGGCLHKDSTPSSSQAASRSKVLLDNLAAAGLLKGYHALGGMKFVLFGSGDGHDENANDKLYTGIYFAYEATDAAAISDVDTGSFTCSWQ